MKQVYDVIVVGGGGSGLAAAVSATEHGASVLLLEKQPDLGGSTGIAVGSFTANRTSMQKNAGISDSLDEHAADAGKFPPASIEAKNNAALRKYFLDHAADSLDWLMKMGLRFQGPNPEPPNRVPRKHNVVPGAKAYIAVLQTRFVKEGGVILTNAPVVGLLKVGSKVAGVIARIEGIEREYRANVGVVLAAGDYANSPQIIGRFKGEEFKLIEGINQNSTGDGHLLSEQVGAKLVNMEITYGPEIRFISPPRPTFQQLLPAHGLIVRMMGWLMPLVPSFVISQMIKRLLVTWQHPEDRLYMDGAILINQSGSRFCDETRTPEREIAIANQEGKYGYILLDEQLIERYSAWPHFVSTAPEIAYAYVEDYLHLRPDVAVDGKTLEEVAQKRNIPSGMLTKTVEQVNQKRQSEGKLLLKGSRWVLLGPAKAYFTTTEGGAAINQLFEVLDTNNQPITGLYAVGQNGLGGQVLWGHGLHIAWAITSGRLVGAHLGATARKDRG